MLRTMLVGHEVHQLPALHQPQPAASSRLAQLEGELCVSTECHLVGLYFTIHIPFKKLCFLKTTQCCA